MADSQNEELPEKRARLEWAATIKQRHGAIREKCAAAVRSNGPQAAEAAWKEAVSDEAALRQYATAMYNLATRSWASTGSESDDRICWIVDCLRQYFVGSVPRSQWATEPSKAPLVIWRSLKAAKRDFFAAHQRAMTEVEVTKWIDDLLSAAAAAGRTDSIVAKAASFADCDSAPTQKALQLIDVGACYNPLNGQPLSEHVRIDAVGVDLGPYPGSGVRKCDWTALRFTTDLSEDPHAKQLASERSTEALEVVPSSCVDAVSFCLLLSFMPTSEMRFRSCVNAWRALRHDGLLVIVSTRTQGSRSLPWLEPWIAAISTIGFQLVRKDVRHSIVGLAFQKVERSCLGRRSEDEFAAALLASSAASQLQIHSEAL